MPLSIKLFVSNLHFNVSDRDLMELFSEFGCITEATVHYNRWGYSLGTGHVIFKNKEDANEAINCYNGIYLDGNPLSITRLAHPSISTSLPPKLPAKVRLSSGSSDRKKPLKRLAKGPHKIVFPQNCSKAGKEKAVKGKNGGRINKRKAKGRINLSVLDLDIELEEYIKGRKAKPISKAVEPVKENSLSDLSDESFKDILGITSNTSSDGELVAQVEHSLDENCNKVLSFGEIPLGAKKGSHSEKGESTPIFSKVKEEPEVGVSLHNVDVAFKKSNCDLKACSENSVDSGEGEEELAGNSVTKHNSREEADDLNLVLEDDEVGDDEELCYDAKISADKCTDSDINEEAVDSALKVKEEMLEYQEDEVNEVSVLEDFTNISYELFDIKEMDESSKEIDPDKSVVVKEEGGTPEVDHGSVVYGNTSTKKVSFNIKKTMEESNSLKLSVDEILLETPENACHTFRIKRKIELENDNASSSRKIKGGNDTDDSDKGDMSKQADELLMKPPIMKRKIKTRTNVRNAPKKKGNFS
ncbi:uncharacterized protein [Palaemon carinicauda]|uniref:uncharacterized protein n=1 Tax=Palaemon carinicauda TaxID=392227 RepID=UPI0035B5ECC4